MFINNYEFSLLLSGEKMRVLAASIDELTGQPGPGQALLTTTPAAAEDLVRCLRHFAVARYSMLATWVAHHPGVRCELRRAVGDVLAAGTEPAVVAHGPLRELAPVIDAANQVSEAGRKTVGQLLLAMVEGCEEIPVRVTFAPEHLEDDATGYANRWLNIEATDEDITNLLDRDFDVVYDSLQWILREQYPWLEEWMEEAWVSITVNHDDLTAWVAANRPHLAR